MSVDHRMKSLVACFGDVPAEARRLGDAEAREHGATWVRRLIGKGIAGQYVIAYEHAERWWTFCFERELDPTLDTGTGDAELWTVESYDSEGRSWCDTFQFDSELSMWERLPRPARPPRPAAEDWWVRGNG